MYATLDTMFEIGTDTWLQTKALIKFVKLNFLKSHCCEPRIMFGLVS